MALVGLSFGSVSGGTGFDVSSTVNQIVTNLQAVETPWKTQLTKLQQQDAVFSTMGTQLSSMLTSLQSLTDFTGVLTYKEGSSSNDSVLTLSSANSSAVAGSHNITVEQLAQTAAYATDKISSTDQITGSITIGSQSFTYGSSDNATLSTLASAINNAGIGVTASIVTDTVGTRLSIVSNTSGSAGAVSITDNLVDASKSNAALGITSTVTAQDAKVLVDGLEEYSSSNTVTNIIPGITMQLLATSTTAVQVQVVNNTSAMESAIASFVTNYNAVMSTVNAQEGNDASGNPEPLYGSTVLSNIQQQLQSAMIKFGGSGGIQSLYDLGIKMNNDGTLSLNADTLDSALNASYASVVSFFQDTGGFGRSLASTLNNLGNVYSSGVITLAEKENTSLEKTLKDKITNQETLISSQKDVLTAELNKANETLQGIPDQLSYVNKIYAAAFNYNGKS